MAAPWSEARYELARRAELYAARRGLDSQGLMDLLAAAVSVAEVHIQVVTLETYRAFKETARLRIPRDPDDWPTVALALALTFPAIVIGGRIQSPSLSLPSDAASQRDAVVQIFKTSYESYKP